MNDKPNPNIDVKLNGKTYIELLKYQESIKRKPFKISPQLRQALPYFMLSLVASIILIVLYNSMFPGQSADPLNFTWNGVLMFMGISAGIGWILHGTGFLLVRVK